MNSVARGTGIAAVSVAVAVLVMITPAQAAQRDTDHDGMPDRWERAHGLNWHHANARGDADHDGISNIKEFRLGSDPRHNDANTACSALASALGGDPSTDCSTGLTEYLN